MSNIQERFSQALVGRALCQISMNDLFFLLFYFCFGLLKLLWAERCNKTLGNLGDSSSQQFSRPTGSQDASGIRIDLFVCVMCVGVGGGGAGVLISV